MKRSTVLFIENLFIVRVGFSQIILEYFRPGIPVTCLSESQLSVDWRSEFQPDLVVIGNTSAQASTLVRDIKAQQDLTRVLIFADALYYQEAMDCLIAGADGFLTQHAEASEIVLAIEQVISGQRYLCRELMEIMAQEALDDNQQRKKRISYDNPNVSPAGLVANLSPRQTEIARHLIHGESLTKISELLGLSPSTIATHKAILFKKLGVSSLVDLRDKYYFDLQS